MLIIKNQNTIISKLDTIITEQRILRQIFEHALQSNMIGSNDHREMTCFKLSPINDAYELKSFDEQLGTDREFRQKLIQYIKYKTNDTRTEQLLHCAIDICFSKKMFHELTWTGRSSSDLHKLCIQSYTNVLDLFKELGRFSHQQLGDFLKKKKNKNSNRRQQLSYQRKPTPRTKTKRISGSTCKMIQRADERRSLA